MNTPTYYQQCSATIDPAKVLQYFDFSLGSFFKYLLRADFKGQKLKDLQKALDYLEIVIDNFEIYGKKYQRKILKYKLIMLAFNNKRVNEFYNALYFLEFGYFKEQLQNEIDDLKLKEAFRQGTDEWEKQCQQKNN